MYCIIHNLPPIDCDLPLLWLRSEINTNQKIPDTQTTLYRTYKILVSVVGVFMFEYGTVDV